MIEISIGKWGNSLGIRLPKHIVQAMNLKLNDSLSVTHVEGKIILEPVAQLGELTLESLLSQITDEPEPEIDWGKPEGEEIW